MPPVVPSRQSLDELARGLELEVCTARLLAHLFPDPAPGAAPGSAPGKAPGKAPAKAAGKAPKTDPGARSEPARAGRHRALETLIEADAGLRTALLSQDEAALAEAWRRCLRERPGDLDLQHDLAVVFRERALRQVAQTGSSGERLVIATTLWALLLATGGFWRRLRVGRDQEAAPREKIAGELLDLHASQGAHALAAGRTASARLHLSCLDACRSGDGPVRDLLEDLLGLRYDHSVDDRRLAETRRVAAAALDRWCADLIEGAESLVNDPEAISRLPEGIPKDYESGIGRLAPLIRLGVPVPRVLSTGLDWHNEWCICLYNAHKDYEGIKRVVVSGRDFADRLAPLCSAGEGHQLENQALSRHLMLRGVVADTDEQAIADLEQALHWNPADDNATKLLAQSHLRRGYALADQGRLGAALKEGRKAQRLLPGDAAIEDFVREMLGSR